MWILHTLSSDRFSRRDISLCAVDVRITVNHSLPFSINSPLMCTDGEKSRIEGTRERSHVANGAQRCVRAKINGVKRFCKRLWNNFLSSGKWKVLSSVKCIFESFFKVVRMHSERRCSFAERAYRAKRSERGEKRWTSRKRHRASRAVSCNDAFKASPTMQRRSRCCKCWCKDLKLSIASCRFPTAECQATAAIGGLLQESCHRQRRAGFVQKFVLHLSPFFAYP